ncbi:MAG: UbiH/UbiF/VisC/COQ6 family ubiquinone biosynthesis hydroxylase [Pseudomonadota bacterium]
MSERVETEVAVVGGGLVGPLLALALARTGQQVALVERVPESLQAEPGFDGRAYAIALASSRLLGAVGLWGDLEPLAEPIRDIKVSEGPAGAPAGLHFDPRALDEARVGWILEDRYLRRALLSAVAAEPGITRIGPAAVVSARFEDGCAHLGLNSGAALVATLAVAADGRGSALARLAGIGRQVFGYGQTGLVAAIEHERPHQGIAHQSFFPGGPFAVLPLPGNRSGLVWSEREGEARRLMALDDAGYEVALARRIGPRLGRLRLVVPRRAHPLSLELADAYVAPRLALAGDAAHGVHPIAGQGLNMGLRDVAALAEVIVGARGRGEDIGDPGVLMRYERWRRFDNTSFALGMDGLARLFSNASPLLGALRRTGLSVVDASAPAKRFFMREAAGLAGRLPVMLEGRLP